MKSVKCFDTLAPVIKKATEQFFSTWRVNEERLDILKEYCEAIDEMAEEFDGISLEVGIVEQEKTIEITMECPEFTILSKQHIYYELVKRSVKFGFSMSDDKNLNVNFVFPSIWEECSM